MADINFDCPLCGQNLEAPPDMAGETIECPACSQQIQIPAPAHPKPAGGKKVILKKKGTSLKKPSSAAPSRSARSAAPAPKPTLTKQMVAKAGVSGRSRTVALLLCFFLGGMGIHRFYVGKVGTGILWLLTVGLFGIGSLVDFIMIIAGAFKDKQGHRVETW